MATLSARLAAMLAAVLLCAPAAAHASAPDWVIVVVTPGSAGASDVAISLTGEARLTGRGPGAVGVGTALAGNSYVSVIGNGATGVAVTTSRELGNIDVNVSPPMGDTFSFDLSFTLEPLTLEPGEKVALLGFFPNASVTSFDHDATARVGTVTEQVRAGTGSTAVVVAGPNNDGMAAAAGPVGAALSLTRVQDSSGGLVGAFNIEVCEGVCLGSWESPSSTGEFVQAYPHAQYGVGAKVGRAWFAGPSGQWTWHWTGTAMADEAPLGSLLAPPVVAAWAPIGGYFNLFH